MTGRNKWEDDALNPDGNSPDSDPGVPTGIDAPTGPQTDWRDRVFDDTASEDDIESGTGEDDVDWKDNVAGEGGE